MRDCLQNRSVRDVSEMRAESRELARTGDAGHELTAGQLGIWHHQRLHPESPVYNVGEYLEIVGDLDVAVFERALRHVVSEIDAFHLLFHADADGRVRQYVDKRDWVLRVIDVSGEADPRAAAEDWMRTGLRRPFDLQNGPVFTEAVLRARSEYFLVVSDCS